MDAAQVAVDAHRVPYGTAQFWVYVGVSLFTVIFAGFASGMTVGLLSIDPIQLKVLTRHGTPEERKRASDVSELIGSHHLLLVTLLLANSIAMETLPIFLDRLMPSWLAVLLSVTCILFFGEVLPQAFCTGPQQLTVAARSAPLVKALIFIFYVVAFPIAKVLDYVLGDHDNAPNYTRPHLKTLIRMHQKESKSFDGHKKSDDGASSGSHPALGEDEVVVIEGALDLANKDIASLMVPIGNVYMLEWDCILSQVVMQDVLRAGHSRVPVYRRDRNNIRGLLIVKSLITVNPDSGTKVHEVLHRRSPLFGTPDMNAYDMLNEFQKGSNHMAFVTEHPEAYCEAVRTGVDVGLDEKILGIVTLEDVIEELIQEEIYDEFDDTAADTLASARTIQIHGPPARSTSGLLGLARMPTAKHSDLLRGTSRHTMAHLYHSADSAHPRFRSLRGTSDEMRGETRRPSVGGGIGGISAAHGGPAFPIVNTGAQTAGRARVGFVENVAMPDGTEGQPTTAVHRYVDREVSGTRTRTCPAPDRSPSPSRGQSPMASADNVLVDVPSDLHCRPAKALATAAPGADEMQSAPLPNDVYRRLPS